MDARTQNYDDKNLQIYGANNQYVAQRLEGYIKISPEFQVPSTKDGIDWEGVEELLIKQLKNYLQNAILHEDANEKSPKKYDLLNNAKK